MRRWFWIIDAIVVVAFSIIGRDDHGFVSDFWDYLRVSAPFLVGLAITIFAIRAWRNPIDWKTGVALALGTVFLGMLLRRFVWDDGTARPFVIVTTLYMVATMVGWRLIALLLRRFVSRRSTTQQ
ncbi:MAG: DUF3054 domain-containing protein [Acidimicrobiia bacterium]